MEFNIQAIAAGIVEPICGHGNLFSYGNSGHLTSGYHYGHMHNLSKEGDNLISGSKKAGNGVQTPKYSDSVP